MEQTHENDAITIPNATPHRDEPKTTQDRPRKRKPGPMHAIKVALFRMGKGSSKSKPLPADDESKSAWTKLIGSMRPMHLQGTQSPCSPPQINDGGLRKQLQATMPTSSPSEYNTDGGDSGSYWPSPASSRYASAVGLNEMVQDEESDIKQENNVVVVAPQGTDGDDMIDAKADVFIAQFYKQMKLQRMEAMDRLYRERSERSLGW